MFYLTWSRDFKTVFIFYKRADAAAAEAAAAAARAEAAAKVIDWNWLLID